MTEHATLTMKPVASGAGFGECSCGWRSKVSDDGKMYEPDYYSSSDITRDWEAHIAATAEVDYLSITRDTVTS